MPGSAHSKCDQQLNKIAGPLAGVNTGKLRFSCYTTHVMGQSSDWGVGKVTEGE